MYSNAKTLLIDDVISSLDATTAQWVVEKCFAGDLMQGRTIIWATHDVSLASLVGRLVVNFSAVGDLADVHVLKPSPSLSFFTTGAGLKGYNANSALASSPPQAALAQAASPGESDQRGLSRASGLE